MFKKDFFLCIKNVQLKYLSSKAQINNTDYNISDNSNDNDNNNNNNSNNK